MGHVPNMKDYEGLERQFATRNLYFFHVIKYANDSYYA